MPHNGINGRELRDEKTRAATRNVSVTSVTRVTNMVTTLRQKSRLLPTDDIVSHITQNMSQIALRCKRATIVRTGKINAP